MIIIIVLLSMSPQNGYYQSWFNIKNREFVKERGKDIFRQEEEKDTNEKKTRILMLYYDETRSNRK